jgi:hypothetical protein
MGVASRIVSANSARQSALAAGACPAVVLVSMAVMPGNIGCDAGNESACDAHITERPERDDTGSDHPAKIA